MSERKREKDIRVSRIILNEIQIMFKFSVNEA